MKRVPGVLQTTVGYVGGHVERPTYRQVCSGTTGHAEAVEVTYDPEVISYEQLAKLFFESYNSYLQGELDRTVSLHTIEYLEGNPMQGRLSPRMSRASR